MRTANQRVMTRMIMVAAAEVDRDIPKMIPRPIFLLAIMTAAFGVFLPELGFYQDDWNHINEVQDARPILPLAAFYMGDLRDGLPMVSSSDPML